MLIISFVPYYFAAITARHSSHNFPLIRRRPPLSSSSYNNSLLPLQMASAGEPRKRCKSSNSNSSSRAEKKQKSATSDIELLQSWIEHDNHTYHMDTFLTSAKAYQIRIRLVSWYRANRRQLPWRGDPGPYDGSTVGYAASASSSTSLSKGKKKKKGGDNGKDIRSFLVELPRSREKKQLRTSQRKRRRRNLM